MLGIPQNRKKLGVPSGSLISTKRDPAKLSTTASLNSVVYVWKKLSGNSGVKTHHEGPTKAFLGIKFHNTNNDLAHSPACCKGNFQCKRKNNSPTLQLHLPSSDPKASALHRVTLMRKVSMCEVLQSNFPDYQAPGIVTVSKKGTVSYRMQVSVQKGKRSSSLKPY